MSEKMKFLIPSPDTRYYLWQILVQIASFREMGYEQDMHIPVVYSGKEPSAILKKFVESKELKCHFYLFHDEREKKGYAASQKPWTMYKYFEKFPERKNDVYNYLDSDVIFTQPMDFSPFMGDNVWYGSNTRSYTGVNYVKSKGEHVFKKMCEICDVDPQMIVNNDSNSIGAQYFIKNNTAELWKEIYDKSMEMYNYFVQEEKAFYARVKEFNPVSCEYKKGDEVKFKGKKYIVSKDHTSSKDKTPDKTKELYNLQHPIQKWTAEMWATQYIALKYGYQLKTSDLMQFHWAGHRNRWHTKPYFHNAGLVKHEPDGVNFVKLAYKNKTPFNQEIKVDVMSASYRYLELIRRTEKYFPELIYE